TTAAGRTQLFAVHGAVPDYPGSAEQWLGGHGVRTAEQRKPDRPTTAPTSCRHRTGQLRIGAADEQQRARPCHRRLLTKHHLHRSKPACENRPSIRANVLLAVAPTSTMETALLGRKPSFYAVVGQACDCQTHG